MQVFGFVNKGGWCGVVLFFVLSGFLITGILWDSFDDPGWWRKFVARRSLRIFPLYFLALALVVLAAIPGGTVGAVLHSVWIPGLFLEDVPGLNRISETIPSPLATFHLWSIAVEEQFYLLWPFLLLLAKTRGQAMKICLAVFVASFGFRAGVGVLHLRHDLWDKSLMSQAGALALGGWLALAARGAEWPRVLRWCPAICCAGAAGFLSTGVFSRDFNGAPMHLFGTAFASLLFTGLVALSTGSGMVATALSAAWLRWLGRLSYGIYVYHVLLSHLFASISDRLAGARSPMVHNLVTLVCAAVLSLAAAYASFHLYERPFLKWKRMFAPKPEAKAEIA
jgi:peptidoglycan/LPS O-acetylase OafA/YrhL